MLPRKLHLEQINRFHDKVEALSKQIDEETDDKKKAELSMNYFILTSKVWSKIDNCVENDIKNTLDIMEN